ncbi:MAG: alpha/beta hydrolase [Xanthomarina sp.]
MKKLAILLLLLFFQNTNYCQNTEPAFPFNVKVEGIGNPIILIPGLACSGEVWNQTVEILKNNYECHVLTLAGFNNQAPIALEKGYLITIEKGLKAYIEKELKSKPIVIGHSLGGFLAMSLASKHSDLLEKIIIVDSYPFMSAAYNPNATAQNIVPQAKMMKDMILSAADSSYMEQQELTMSTLMHDPDNMKLATKWSLESSRETIAQAMYELMTTDLRTQVSNIKIPVLVLGSWFGGKDYGITKDMVKRIFESQFKDTPFVTIKIADTAKHFIMWDEEQWFYENVQTFIRHEK